MNLQIESRSDVASRRTTRLIGVLFALLIAGGMTWFFLSRPRPNSPQAGSEVKVDLAANLESDLAQAPAESSAVSPEPDIQKHPNLEVGTPEQNFAVSELPTVIAESQEVVPEPQPMSPADAMAESAANARAALVEAEDVFAERQHDYQTAEATLATVVREIDERNRAESAGSDSTKEERARKELEARLKSAAAAEEKARALLAEKESAEQKAETAKANSEAALAGLTSMIEDKATAFSAISKAADEMKKIAKKRTAEFDAAAKTKVQAGKSLEEKSAAVAEAKQAIEEDDTAKAARIGTPRSLDELQSSLAELKQSVGEAGVEMDAATEQQKQLRETLEQAEQSLNELTAPATGQSENELRDDQRNAATKALEEDRAKFAQAKADREKVEHPNTLAAASANDSSDVAFVNSLGMKFVSVGDVQFSVWLTRHRDFEQFARATELKSNGWSDPGFRQGPDHPVVMVSWDQAVQFCQWLTERERRDGMIKPNQIYRLPTDAEWSAAVGLSAEKGNTPETRDMGVPNVYPWGTQWPPPPNAGNYTGQETQTEAAIRGYVDGFAWTSPVGSFPPNKVGLFDMGGNVWEWCLDSWSPESTEKVLRGGSWFNGDVPLSLLSSCRVHAAPESSMDYYGFRVVLARNPNE